MPAPITAYQDRSVRMASLGHLLLAVWRAPPDAGALVEALAVVEHGLEPP